MFDFLCYSRLQNTVHTNYRTTRVFLEPPLQKKGGIFKECGDDLVTIFFSLVELLPYGKLNCKIV